MKTKDLIYLLLAAAIFLVAGYIGYTQLVPKKGASATKAVTVEVVGSIPSQLDTSSVNMLNDPTKTKDLGSPVDLSGLNNTAPFGQ